MYSTIAYNHWSDRFWAPPEPLSGPPSGCLISLPWNHCPPSGLGYRLVTVPQRSWASPAWPQAWQEAQHLSCGGHSVHVGEWLCEKGILLPLLRAAWASVAALSYRTNPSLPGTPIPSPQLSSLFHPWACGLSQGLLPPKDPCDVTAHWDSQASCPVDPTIPCSLI